MVHSRVELAEGLLALDTRIPVRPGQDGTGTLFEQLFPEFLGRVSGLDSLTERVNEDSLPAVARPFQVGVLLAHAGLKSKARARCFLATSSHTMLHKALLGFSHHSCFCPDLNSWQ